MKVFRSMVLDAPVERVWAAARAFDAVVDWNPGVIAARMESGSPIAVGSVRHLDVADGTVFRETLLAHSDLEYFYAYDIVEGPLPCRDYMSTHRFIPSTEGDRTLGIWQAEFECNRDDEAKLDEIVGDRTVRTNVEEAGFDVVAIKGTEAPSLAAICETPLGDIRSVFHDVARSDCDAVLQVGTALPVVALLDELESEIDKPIVACNAAVYWQALRAAGIADRIAGFGRLLAEH